MKMRLSELKLATSNLIEMFGRTDNIAVGVGVSLLLATPGLLAWYFGSGWVMYLGAFWALLNLVPLVQVVTRL